MFAAKTKSRIKNLLWYFAVAAAGCSHHKANTSSVTAPAVPLTGSNLSSADAGRYVFTSSCSDCHAAPSISKYSANQWNSSIIPSMSAKAGLNSTEKQQLTDYVTSVLNASGS